MIDILVCYTGRSDWQCVASDTPWDRGPIRELLHERISKKKPFDEAHILHHVTKEEDVPALRAFEDKLNAEFNTDREWIFFHPVNLTSPIDHASITAETRRVLDEIEHDNPGARWHFHLSPGTPAMSMVLAVLGRTLYPAILYQTSKESREVSETDIPVDIGYRVLDTFARRFERLTTVDERCDQKVFDAFARITRIKDSKLDRIVREAAVVAGYPSVPVTILGETGTGKELLARAIHDASPLYDKPYVPFNAAAVPGTLVEAELFGAEPGAYTGMTKSRRPGLIESANGGTLFIDEFCEMPLDLQVKLLRFLNDGRYRPVGYNGEERSASCRIIVATNRDPYGMIRTGRLRADLYHRVNGVVFQLPSLRERGKDILEIAGMLTRELNEELAKDSETWREKRLSVDARRFLTEYPWPGNVRELRNTLRRAFIFATKEEITRADLESRVDRHLEDHESLLPDLTYPGTYDLDEILTRIRKHYKQRALKLCEGNKAKAAKMLSLSKWTDR